MICFKKRVSHISLLILVSLSIACNDQSGHADLTYDSLTEEQKHLPENAVRGLKVAEGLEVTLMAAEPILQNPTNIDVDDRGRIWVCEAFNYRPGQSATTIPEGDRIMILEDNDGDGKIDTAKVFYQGPEINAPLGICVMPDKVIVSQSPYVWAFYDDNNDDKADRKEIVFQNISGEQHDHGMHAFTTGPDGKLYFNFGNEGKTLRDRNNKVVLDQYGDSINAPKYRQGMVFRSNPDFTEIERLGHNFRNNYEVAVDSYGLMWQSDNDDDGNRGVRINYVMDYGNYGYTDEMTGAWWSSNRTNIEDSIPFRHWHLNDPGVVPNLLQTGSGSPTGMIVYEGEMLPEKFRNQMIHCEPGHNVVRSYPVKDQGAGYSATIDNVLTGEKDQWFRPSDICVAPDGSLIIADWYDPVVGGHDARDKESGRIYRIATTGTAYKMPKIDYSTPENAVNALKNPNLVARRKAWVALQSFGAKAIPALEKLWQSNENSRMRARAFWALAKLPGGEKYLEKAAEDKEPGIRIAAIRAAREAGNGQASRMIGKLIHDKDPHVRRENLLALHRNNSSESAQQWVSLASHYDGKDRWYLEALGIAAADQWDSFFDVWLENNKNQIDQQPVKDIIWRARTDKNLTYLSKLATDRSVDLKTRLRYFRAFDFNNSKSKSQVLIGMIKENSDNDPELNALILQALDPGIIQTSAVAKNALTGVLKANYGLPSYIELVKRYEVKSEVPRLIQLAIDKPEDKLAQEAISLVIEFDGQRKLDAIVHGKDAGQASRLLNAMGFVGNKYSVETLQDFLLGKKYSEQLRKTAAENIGKTYYGEEVIFNLVKAKRLPEQYKEATLLGLESGPRRSMLIKIKERMENKSAEDAKPFDRESVMALNGNASRGQVIFKSYCSSCHQVRGEGTEFGPNLSEIGSKLPKDGLLEAIVNPSGGVSFGYETTQVNMKDGNSITGLLAGKTESEIQLRLPGGQSQTIKTAEVRTMKKSPESMMPELHQSMSAQELADLVAYLSALEKK